MLIRLVTTGALLALAAAPCLSQDTYPPIVDLEWTYGAEPQNNGEHVTLVLSRKGQRSSFDTKDAAEWLGPHALASLGRPGQPVAFTVRREAGTIACNGTVVTVGRAAGDCRFDPDHGFVSELNRRHLAPRDSDELLVLALVDARMASVDGLSREGFEIAEVDTVIALAALEVTPEFARSLREAGLVIADTDDLTTAKAVGVDPAWLRGMAEAGYAELDAERAIQMRALDITPDYARKMSRVMAALEGNEAE